MNSKIELGAYFTTILVLASLLFQEGQKRVDLQSQISIPPQELYKKLSNSQTKLQIIDIRSDQSSYEDAHVPGAIPLYNCDFLKGNESTTKNIFTFAPTIIVSENGDENVFRDCAKNFTQARNLAGGMAAWSEEGLPEDSSEYSPPKLSGGGGCL